MYIAQTPRWASSPEECLLSTNTVTDALKNPRSISVYRSNAAMGF
nr:MAG TPA: hypothetical protein [Microviridae sp.]